MKLFKVLLVVFVFLPQMAWGGFDLMTSLGTFKSQNDNTLTQSLSQLELRAGYSFEDFGLFLGMFYSLGSNKFIQHTDQYYIGPMVGYKLDCGFYTLAGYTLFSEQDRETGGIKYTSGTGAQISIGHALPIAEDILLAPEFTWRSITYDKQETLGVSSDIDREDKVFYPSVTLWFKF